MAENKWSGMASAGIQRRSRVGGRCGRSVLRGSRAPRHGRRAHRPARPPRGGRVALPDSMQGLRSLSSIKRREPSFAGVAAARLAQGTGGMSGVRRRRQSERREPATVGVCGVSNRRTLLVSAEGGRRRGNPDHQCVYCLVAREAGRAVLRCEVRHERHNKGMKLTKPGQLRSFAAYPRCWADTGECERP